jgi:hypothetical protein
MRAVHIQVAIRIAGSLLLAFLITVNASAGQFKKVVYRPAGQGPYRVVAAQFTQSGNLDLAFSDFDGNQITILLGNGDGTFQSARKFAVINPFGLAAGDFNEDGNLDLAVVEPNGTGDGTIAIFLGDGKGGFKLSGSNPIGIESVNVAVADFNGDGHLDVAVTDQGFEGPGDVIVFFGNGHGKLAKAAKFKMPQGPVGIAAGDLNGDNHPDLAVTQISNGSVAVFINDGTGKFHKPVTYSSGSGEAVDVKIADLRHDARQDLVVANSTQGMVVLLNTGDGHFGVPKIYRPTFHPVGPPEACVVADFNLDGKLDVACAADLDDSYVFYGKGDGTFPTSARIHNTIQNQGGFSIAAGDFNNDKAPDLAIPIQDKGKVAIMLNTK